MWLVFAACKARDDKRRQQEVRLPRGAVREGRSATNAVEAMLSPFSVGGRHVLYRAQKHRNLAAKKAASRATVYERTFWVRSISVTVLELTGREKKVLLGLIALIACRRYGGF